MVPNYVNISKVNAKQVFVLVGTKSTRIFDFTFTGISGQEGRIYDCSPLANISKYEFSRDVFFLI